MPLSQLSISATFTPQVSTTATPTSLSLSTTSAAVLAANSNRKGMTLPNTTGKTIYLCYSETATVANAIPIPDGSLYEMPEPIYTGALSAILSTGTATPVVIELT